jgi:hypothetical protein
VLDSDGHEANRFRDAPRAPGSVCGTVRRPV